MPAIPQNRGTQATTEPNKYPSNPTTNGYTQPVDGEWWRGYQPGYVPVRSENGITYYGPRNGKPMPLRGYPIGNTPEPALTAATPQAIRTRRRIPPSARFLRGKYWKVIRLQVLERDGRRCARCGSTSQPQVDHILPKSRHPEVCFDPANLQVLCWPCNRQKAAR